MSQDIKYKGLNLSAGERNFNTLKKIVLEQREIIKTQNKDIKLCFKRIEALKKTKKDKDIGDERVNDFMGVVGDIINKR